MKILQVVIYILLLLLLLSVISIIFEKKNRQDLDLFRDLFFENFHLNNAATFIGYTVFDYNTVFLIFYIYSMVIYLFEHFFVIEDRKMGKGVHFFQIVVFVVGILGQIFCAYIILSKGEQ